MCSMLYFPEVTLPLVLFFLLGLGRRGKEVFLASCTEPLICACLLLKCGGRGKGREKERCLFFLFLLFFPWPLLVLLTTKGGRKREGGKENRKESNYPQRGEGGKRKKTKRIRKQRREGWLLGWVLSKQMPREWERECIGLHGYYPPLFIPRSGRETK